jgi:hypothetical protein
MTRLGLTQRLVRLEDAAAGGLPLYVRHWLGEALTADEQATAAVEWEQVRSTLSSTPPSLSADHQGWLAGRDAP